MKAFTFTSLVTLLVGITGLAQAAGVEPKDPFDRLDGVGPSSMNVRVVDWAGNIELQISPMGKVKTLGFKIDRETDKDRPVLVIEYQWKHLPYRQIRRALLTTPLKEGFKIYYDASYGDRDRYILTNHVPEKKNLVAFTQGPEPTQLWPDHHENLLQKTAASAPAAAPEKKDAEFAPYSTETRPSKPQPRDVQADRPSTYVNKRPATSGVQFQQGQVEIDQDGTGTVRKRLREDHAEDVRQGFDF